MGAGLLGESDHFGASVAKSDEGKIRGLIANFNAHNEVSVVEADRMQIVKLKNVRGFVSPAPGGGKEKPGPSLSDAPGLQLKFLSR